MRFNSLLVSVTERCHVGCAHCGFIGAVREREPEPNDMAEWVRQACEYGIPKIIFTGGEPFERLDCLIEGVKMAEKCGTPAAVFTSSYWAKTLQETRETLSRLTGLKHLYLSSDVFHQKRVPYDYVHHVIHTAMEMEIPTITICVTYTNEGDRDEVLKNYESYGSRLRYSVERVIPNPFFSKKVLQHQAALLAPREDQFRCRCEIGTPILNPNGDIFSCHIGKAAAHRDLRSLPYYLGNMFQTSFEEIMGQASSRPEYQFLRTHGPRGVAGLYRDNPDLIQSIGRDGFTNECDMCFSTLSNPEGVKALRAHVAKQQIQTEIDLRLALTLREEPLGSVLAVEGTAPSVSVSHKQ